MNKTTLLAVLVLAVTGCKKDESATGASAKEAMGLFAKGYNDLIKDPRSVIEDYDRTIPASGPIESAKPHLFGQNSFAEGTIKEAHEAFDAAKKEAPASLAKLGPLADKAIAAADKVMAVYADAYKYYDAEQYKDDHMAKGTKLHADWQAAEKDFDAAMHAFGDGLSEVEDLQAADELKSHEDKKDYAYWWREQNLEAKKLLAVAEKGDVGELKKAIEAWRPKHEQFAKWIADKGSNVAQAFHPYASASDRFETAVTKMNREPSDATLGEMINAYNSMITGSNGLAQLEGTPALE